MKNIFSLFLFSLVIILGCKKDPAPLITPVEPTHLTDLGTIAFKKNNMGIVMSATISYSGNKIFHMQTGYRKILQTPSLEEKFSITRIPYSIGKYKLYNFPTSNFGEAKPNSILSWTIELDQPVAHLRSTDLYPDDFIEVIEIDTIAKTVEGRFQLHLNNVKNFDLSEFNLPDSVYVTEGAFYLKTE
ncbi:MAG: hypothetical protein RIR11_114 [Bacteroidota bacterium]|jgi:hypothetical protein